MRTLAATLALTLSLVVPAGGVEHSVKSTAEVVNSDLKFKIISKGKLVAEWYNPKGGSYFQTYTYKGKLYGCVHENSLEIFYVYCRTEHIFK